MSASRYARLEGTFIERAALAQSVAIVGGVGALGNEVAKNLAMLGCGRILVVDFDVIELHDATRSVMLCMGGGISSGEERPYKATHVAEMVRALNPDVEAAAFVGDVSMLGPGIYRRADMVFSAFDNLRARFSMNRACSAAGRTMVNGGLGNRVEDVLSGAVAAFDAAAGACFACGLSQGLRSSLADEEIGSGSGQGCTERSRVIVDGGGVPSTPMMASIIGGAQVVLGLKGLMRHPRFPLATGEEARWFLSRSPRFQRVPRQRDPDCPYHQGASSPDLVLTERSTELGLRDLVLRASEALARPATLQLPHALATRLRCERCGKEEARWSTFAAAARRRCSSCGESGLFPVGEALVAVGEKDELESTSLLDLGFPWGQSYEAHALEAEGGSTLLEVGGDFEALFERDSHE